MVEVATTGLARSAAQVYDELFVPALFGQFTGPVLHAADVRRGHDVLDVGCGTGVLAVAAAGVTPEGSVTGVDISPDMLAVAAEKALDVTWRQADAQQLPFGAGAFDAVVSQFALMFFADPVAALREMARVARPGGRIAVAVWGRLEDSPGYAALTGVLTDTLGADAAASLSAPFALGDSALLEDLFRAALLRASTTRHVGTARFASLEQWVRTEIRGWTLAEAVDEASLRRLHEVASQRLRGFAGPRGDVAFPVPALIAAATVD
jgi:SAM-dependent methyltransferase